jgi:hypothetical protein
LRYACLLAILGVLAVALVPRATAKQHSRDRAQAADHALLVRLLEGITTRRDETWRWQRMMHRSRTPYGDSARRIRSVGYRKWVLRLWHHRAVAAKRHALNPPHRREWLCIHNFEAKWTDPDAPYFGGLQMDREFQATYGSELLRSKGTADHWTPLEQMWVAERAYRTRGFWPWPNTARFCGLL